MTHTVSDFVVRLKNAIRANHSYVKMANTKLIRSLANILLAEGFLEGISYEDVSSMSSNQSLNQNSYTINLHLRYVGKKNAITEVSVVSKPGKRIYSNARKLPRVLGGLGSFLVTTSKGIMTDKKARSLNIGGEVLLSIW